MHKNNNYHNHHAMLLTRTSLTLSRQPSLSSIAPGGLPGYTLYRPRVVVYRFLLVVRNLLVYVPRSTGVQQLWVLHGHHGKQRGRRKGGRIRRQLNGTPNQVLGGWIPRHNSQDQILRSENYCCTSIRVACVEENKRAFDRLPR